jgi:hypothetical protein
VGKISRWPGMSRTIWRDPGDDSRKSSRVLATKPSGGGAAVVPFEAETPERAERLIEPGATGTGPSYAEFVLSGFVPCCSTEELRSRGVGDRVIQRSLG